MSRPASYGSGRQACNSKQVVGGSDHVGMHLDPLAATVASLAQPAGGFHPTEGFLDPLAEPLTERIARMTGGTRVERRSSGPAEILRHVRVDVELATRGHEIESVITLSPAKVMRR